MNENDIKRLFSEMLAEQREYCRNNAVYHQDITELGGRYVLGWDLCGVLATQFLTPESCDYTMGEIADESDLVFSMKDLETVDRFLHKSGYRGSRLSRKIQHESSTEYVIAAPVGKIVETENGSMKRERIDVLWLTSYNRKFSYYQLSRFPIYKHFANKPTAEDRKGDNGFYVPINASLGKLGNGILAEKIFDHFFDRAGHIFRLPACPCRSIYSCENHDIKNGCMQLGDGTLDIENPDERGRFITADEAKQTLRDAVTDGLIPLLGRSEGEARGFGVKDKDHFLTTCYCCECCCTNGYAITEGTSENIHDFSRLPGLSLTVDHDTCIGCGKCLRICRFRGVKIENKKAVIQDRCLGCGRCEAICPTGAISFVLESEETMVEEAIAQLESIVDVSPQRR